MPVNTLFIGPQAIGDGSIVFPRSDNYGATTIQQLGGNYNELTRRGTSFVYSQGSAGVANIPPLVNSTITTGAFVVGQRYVITNIGDTDFTLIGAASNTVGVEFVATGVGAGTTGQANQMASCIILTNPATSGFWFFPTKITWGIVSGASIVLDYLAMWTIPSTNVVVGTNGYAAPINGLIGGTGTSRGSYQGFGSNMLFQNVGASLTVAPTYLKSLGVSILNNDMTTKNTMNYDSDQSAGVIIKPGYALLVAPTSIMVALSVISMAGYELPAPVGA